MSKPRNEDSRRDFFRESSFLIAGALPAVGHRAINISSKTPLRVAIFGCGRRGMALSRALVESPYKNVAITAAFDVRKDRVHQLFRSLRSIRPDAVLFDPRADSEADLEQHCLSDAFDAVVFATPPTKRFDEINLAVASGKHAFVETPALARAKDLEGLSNLLSQIASNELVVHFGHQRVACGATREALDQIRRGALGKVRHVRILTACGSRQLESVYLEQLSDSLLTLHEVIDDQFDLVAPLDPANFDQRIVSAASFSKDLSACRFRTVSGITLDVYKGALKAENGTKKLELIDGQLGSCNLTACRLVNRFGRTVWRAQERPLNQHPAINSWLAAIDGKHDLQVSPSSERLLNALRNAFAVGSCFEGE